MKDTDHGSRVSIFCLICPDPVTYMQMCFSTRHNRPDFITVLRIYPAQKKHAWQPEKKLNEVALRKGKGTHGHHLHKETGKRYQRHDISFIAVVTASCAGSCAATGSSMGTASPNPDFQTVCRRPLTFTFMCVLSYGFLQSNGIFLHGY